MSSIVDIFWVCIYETLNISLSRQNFQKRKMSCSRYINCPSLYQTWALSVHYPRLNHFCREVQMKNFRVRPSKYPYFLSWNIESPTFGGAASSYVSPVSPGRFLQSEIIELKRILRKISRAQCLMSGHRNLTMKYRYKVHTEIRFDKNNWHFAFHAIKRHCIVMVWHSDDCMSSFLTVI